MVARRRRITGREAEEPPRLRDREIEAPLQLLAGWAGKDQGSRRRAHRGFP